MDYLNKLEILKKNLRSGFITKESFQSDLEFLLSEIKSALEKLEAKEDEILYPNFYGTANLDIIKTLDLLNCVVLTKNIDTSLRLNLQRALFQGHYALVINTCEVILESDLPSKVKLAIKDIYYAALFITGYEDIKEKKKILIKSRIIINNYIELCKMNYPNWLLRAEKNEAILSRALSKTNPYKQINISEDDISY